MLHAEVPDFGSETFVFDFMRDHSMEVVNKSGIQCHKDIGTETFQAYSFTNKKILIKLPSGRQFEQRVEIGTIDVMNGEIVQFETHGLIMPHDQAYEVAKATLINLG